MEANLPNALTVSRILATPVVCLLLFVGIGRWAAGWRWPSGFIACVTDFLDG